MKVKMHPINQSQLYKLSNKTKLAELVGLPRNTFRKPTNFDLQYKDFQQEKKNGTVTYRRVRKLFIEKFKMSSDIAEIMTKLLTHNRKIPTGGAASMLVAYFAYEDMLKKYTIMPLKME